MDLGVWDTAIADLESKDTKRRLRGLDRLAERLQQQQRQEQPADNNNQWQALVRPLVGTLRDNNFKVCRSALACLESLTGQVGIDITPFLSTIIPGTVECLGNSKAAVQDKGIDLLLAIAQPNVNGAQSTLASLEQGGQYFRHKNWRVREQLMRFLGRAVEVDAAGVCARPAPVLAGVLAEALNDSAEKVRQHAMVAAGAMVELFPGGSLLVSGRKYGGGQLWYFAHSPGWPLYCAAPSVVGYVPVPLKFSSIRLSLQYCTALKWEPHCYIHILTR